MQLAAGDRAPTPPNWYTDDPEMYRAAVFGLRKTEEKRRKRRKRRVRVGGDQRHCPIWMPRLTI